MVLLRYLTDAPRELADRAAGILSAAERRRVDVVVAPLVVAEVVYVLESVYRWDRGRIAAGFIDLVTADVLEILERDVLVRALEWYRDFPSLDFVDVYVASLAVARGGGTVISFDRDLRRLPGVRIVDRPERIPPRPSR